MLRVLLLLYHAQTLAPSDCWIPNCPNNFYIVNESYDYYGAIDASIIQFWRDYVIYKPSLAILYI